MEKYSQRWLYCPWIDDGYRPFPVQSLQDICETRREELRKTWKVYCVWSLTSVLAAAESWLSWYEARLPNMLKPALQERGAPLWKSVSASACKAWSWIRLGKANCVPDQGGNIWDAKLQCVPLAEHLLGQEGCIAQEAVLIGRDEIKRCIEDAHSRNHLNTVFLVRMRDSFRGRT